MCSINVVAASGECLRAVLASKTGAAVLCKLEEDTETEALSWCHYLQPFKPQKRKKVVTMSQSQHTVCYCYCYCYCCPCCGESSLVVFYIGCLCVCFVA